MNASSSMPQASSRKFNVKRLLLLVVIPLIALGIGGVIYLKGGRYVETDNAYLKADKVPISAPIAGTIQTVLVHENESVKQGQPLFRLDTAPLEVALQKADAQVAQVTTDLETIRASYKAKQAELVQAKTKYAFALKDQQRKTDLVNKHFLSSSVFDDAQEATDLAKQQMDIVEQDLKQIATSLGGTPDKPLEQQASYRAALAAVAQAKLDLTRATVYASLPGTVSELPKPGQYLAAGATALALVVTDHWWIEANFPETDLTYVHPGQAVQIAIDTYPNQTWQGEVESISPATGAEFSLIPAQNATGNWVKIAQRVPVRIKLNPSNAQTVLRAGLSTVVTIDTGHQRRLLGFSL